MEPFVPLRVPLIENLRRDPYERATITSNTYYDWLLDRAFLVVPAQAYVANFLATFKEFRRDRNRRVSRSIGCWRNCTRRARNNFSDRESHRRRSTPRACRRLDSRVDAIRLEPGLPGGITQQARNESHSSRTHQVPLIGGEG